MRELVGFELALSVGWCLDGLLAAIEEYDDDNVAGCDAGCFLECPSGEEHPQHTTATACSKATPRPGRTRAPRLARGGSHGGDDARGARLCRRHPWAPTCASVATTCSSRAAPDPSSASSLRAYPLGGSISERKGQLPSGAITKRATPGHFSAQASANNSLAPICPRAYRLTRWRSGSQWLSRRVRGSGGRPRGSAHDGRASARRAPWGERRASPACAERSLAAAGSAPPRTRAWRSSSRGRACAA